MFYGQMGGKDLLKRKWKDLSEFVKLECDGKDLTNKLKELKVHAIVFLNIPSYGGGTRPWNRAAGAVDPATDDGLIEVIGLTTYQLVSVLIFTTFPNYCPILEFCISSYAFPRCHHLKKKIIIPKLIFFYSLYFKQEVTGPVLLNVEQLGL